MVVENRIPWRTGPIQITISIGVTQNRTGNKDSIRKLIDRADEALYRAKETGRNQVKVRSGGLGEYIHLVTLWKSTLQERRLYEKSPRKEKA